MAHDHATILFYQLPELQSLTKQAAQRKDRKQHRASVLNVWGQAALGIFATSCPQLAY